MRVKFLKNTRIGPYRYLKGTEKEVSGLLLLARLVNEGFCEVVREVEVETAQVEPKTGLKKRRGRPPKNKVK